MMKPDQDYIDGVESINAEAGGVWGVSVVRAETAVQRLLAGIMAGDRTADAMIGAIERFLIKTHTEPLLCMKTGCPAVFTKNTQPAAFMFVMPHREDRTQLMACGICRTCAAATDAQLCEIALKQQGLAPFTEHEPGHA